MPPRQCITIRLTPALDALLSASVGQGSSVSDIVREALEAYLGSRQTTRQTARQTQSTSAATSASATSDTMADEMADIWTAMMSDVSDIRQRLGQLEQRVEELSDSVRQSRTLSDTPETLDVPAPQASDTMSDRPQTPEKSPPSPPPPVLSDVSDIPPFDTRKFVLGPLCKKHHDYYGTGQTLRWVKSHGCPQCDVERTRDKRKALREGPP